MDIIRISTYNNNEYHDLIQGLKKLKISINNFVNTLEERLFNFIHTHTKEASFNIQAFENIEKYFSIEKLVDEMNKVTKVEQCNLSGMIRNKKVLEKMKEHFLQQFNEVEEHLKNYLKANYLELISLQNQSRSQDIQLLDRVTLKKETLSNGRWDIQTIKVPLGITSIKLKVLGSDIMFGISSLDRMEKAKYYIADWAPQSYFIKQDGIHYGFGLSEVEQEFDFPEFICNKGDIVQILYIEDSSKLIFENLKTKNRQVFEIPETIPNWCFIIGFRFQNESVILLDD